MNLTPLGTSREWVTQHLSDCVWFTPSAQRPAGPPTPQRGSERPPSLRPSHRPPCGPTMLCASIYPSRNAGVTWFLRYACIAPKPRQHGFDLLQLDKTACGRAQLASRGRRHSLGQRALSERLVRAGPRGWDAGVGSRAAQSPCCPELAPQRAGWRRGRGSVHPQVAWGCSAGGDATPPPYVPVCMSV